ncbi:MAG TPA: ribonuclease P protein component [Armatimonadota bacterium]
MRKQRDFDRLYREGSRVRGRFLTLVWRPAAPDEPLRAATIASRKVGGAVVRNLVKRRLRNLLDAVPWIRPAGCDLAFIAHPGAADASFAELREQVDRAVRRAGLVGE